MKKQVNNKMTINITTSDTIIIIGTGHSGYNLAQELRKNNDKINIIMFTMDDGSLYAKPLLSTAFSKEVDVNDIPSYTAQQMEKKLNIRIYTFTTVNEIDTISKNIQTISLKEKLQNNVKEFKYDKLILTTGANAKTYPLSDSKLIHSINNLQEYQSFHKELQGKKEIAIIGAGFVACEFANDLSTMGFKVKVIAPSKSLVNYLIPKQASDKLKSTLEKYGVEFYLEAKITKVTETQDNRIQFQFTDSSKIEQKFKVDLAISAIGLTPNINIAKKAGIETNSAIIVDRYLQTSIKDIYAFGDSAEVNGVRKNFIAPTRYCAAALAQTLLGNPSPVSYPAMPFRIKAAKYPIVICTSFLVVDRWETIKGDESSIKCLGKTKEGKLASVVLTGKYIVEKENYVKELPKYF